MTIIMMEKDDRTVVDATMAKVLEMKEIVAFMNGPDKVTLGRMIGFFSVPGKYLHPRELKPFWESLDVWDQNWFRVELSKAETWGYDGW